MHAVVVSDPLVWCGRCQGRYFAEHISQGSKGSRSFTAELPGSVPQLLNRASITSSAIPHISNSRLAANRSEPKLPSAVRRVTTDCRLRLLNSCVRAIRSHVVSVTQHRRVPSVLFNQLSVDSRVIDYNYTSQVDTSTVDEAIHDGSQVLFNRPPSAALW